MPLPSAAQVCTVNAQFHQDMRPGEAFLYPKRGKGRMQAASWVGGGSERRDGGRRGGWVPAGF